MMDNEEAISEAFEQSKQLGRTIIQLIESSDAHPVVAVAAVENVLLAGYQSVLKMNAKEMSDRFTRIACKWMDES